jgi:hypothetical protein
MAPWPNPYRSNGIYKRKKITPAYRVAGKSVSIGFRYTCSRIWRVPPHYFVRAIHTAVSRAFLRIQEINKIILRQRR